MNEKLIRRAATKYRDWLVSQIQSQIQFEERCILDSLCYISNQVVKMETWTKHFLNGSQPRVQQSGWDDEQHKSIVCSSAYETIATNIIPELEKDVIRTTQHVTTTLKSLITQKAVTIIPPREAIDEISAIISAWPEVTFGNNILSVLIKDITLKDDIEEVDLGSFWMCIDLTYPLKTLHIKSVNCIDSNDGHYHPHVSDTQLCLGDGDLLSKDALYHGRLEDYFRIVEAVMRTYNEDSAYSKLENWYGPDHEDEFFCEQCEEWRSNETFLTCNMCYSTYCDYCDHDGSLCTDCNEWHCGECSTTCDDCNNTVCNECCQICSNCNSVVCSSCLNKCTICDNKYCYSCESLCVNCGDSVCKNCITMCKCCGENCCINCINETCAICNNGICKECHTTCEHCGIPMCSTCKDEHNCLLAEIKD